MLKPTDGSTGSGKSFTMTGERSAPGVIPRAITEIFNLIKTTTAADTDVHFLVRMSYVELYNNNFRNLLEFASKDQPNSQHPNNSHNHHANRSGHGLYKNAKKYGSYDRWS